MLSEITVQLEPLKDLNMDANKSLINDTKHIELSKTVVKTGLSTFMQLLFLFD